MNGRKKRLPAVVPDTRAHGVIFQQAEQRRAARLAKKRRRRLSETPERAADRILKPITHRQGSPTLAPALEVRPAACCCLDNRYWPDIKTAAGVMPGSLS